MNMAEVVSSPIATAGTRIPASLSLGASWGKGGVGERALRQVSIYTEYLQYLLSVDVLCESLPAIRNITNDVHDRPHFQPHRLLHRLLRLIVMSLWLISLRTLLG